MENFIFCAVEFRVGMSFLLNPWHHQKQQQQQQQQQQQKN